MNRQQESKVVPSLEEAEVYIRNMPLAAVIQRVVREKKWSSTDVHELSSQYRKFLFLIKKHGDKHQLPPSKDMDEIWHAHVLFTQQYHRDCQHIFGHYFHHQPATQSKAEAEKMQTLFATTQQLFHQEFGEYLYDLRLKRSRGFLSRIIKRKL